MQTYITFQYKPAGKNKRPDDVTFTDVMSPLTVGAALPGIGDIVTLQLASNLREFRESQPGSHKSVQVIGRNFSYTTKDGMGSGQINGCNVYIIVTDVEDDVPGVDIKE